MAREKCLAENSVRVEISSPTTGPELSERNYWKSPQKIAGCENFKHRYRKLTYSEMSESVSIQSNQNSPSISAQGQAPWKYPPLRFVVEHLRFGKGEASQS